MSTLAHLSHKKTHKIHELDERGIAYDEDSDLTMNQSRLCSHFTESATNT